MPRNKARRRLPCVEEEDEEEGSPERTRRRKKIMPVAPSFVLFLPGMVAVGCTDRISKGNYVSIARADRGEAARLLIWNCWQQQPPWKAGEQAGE